MTETPAPQPQKTTGQLAREKFAKLGFGTVKLFTALQKDASIDRLVREHRFKSIRAGDTPVNQGEYTSELCVVLYGRLDVYRADAGGTPLSIGSLGPGEWFGDSSALSNQPSLATVEAKTDCVLVVVDAAIFKALYRDEKAFKELVDAQYKERALAAHLRVVPLFKYLSERELDSIRKGVEFLDVAENVAVARQGDAVDAVYLVRSGAVKVTSKDAQGAQRILSYLMENSAFGEGSAAGGEQRWPGTYETMARTNIVKVPLAVLEKLRADSPGSGIARAAQLIAQQENQGTSGVFDLLDRASKEGPVGGSLTRERIEIMVSKQSVKGGHALVIDLTKCVRCNACVESCVAVHADRVPRLSKTGSRVSTQKTLASACYHCEIPECMMACGYGAIRRDLRGSIEFIWDNCVGCTSCVMGCPYNVIRMTPPPDQMAAPDDVSVLSTLPLIGQWFRAKTCSTPSADTSKRSDGAPLKQYNKVTGKEETVSGKAIKCDLCAGMPFEACVYNCPCAAILRVAPEDIFEAAE